MKQQILIDPWPETECVIADKYRNASRRQNVNYHGESMTIAKANLIKFNGHPPFEGAYALHLCHKEYCVNPKHLYWGTAKENSHDRIETLLSEQDVYDIRTSKDTIAELAKEYAVMNNTISRIQRGLARSTSPGPIREKSHRPRISDQEVYEIRMSKDTVTNIAKKYGRTRGHISSIQTGRYRKNHPGPIRKARTKTADK